MRKKRKTRAVADPIIYGPNRHGQPETPQEPIIQFSQQYANRPTDPPNTDDVQFVAEILKTIPKKRGESSVVHKYFDCTDGKHAAQCIPCIEKKIKRAINIEGATTLALNHLREEHKELTDVPQKKKSPAKAKLLQAECTTEEKFRSQVALWIAETAQPFTIVDHAAFREMFASYREGFELPSSFIISTRITKLYTDDRNTLKLLLQKTCETITISLDIWTSSNYEAYLAIFGHWTTPDFRYEEHILDFIHLTGRHTALIQAELVLDCLQEYDVTHKLFNIVGDNAAVNEALAGCLLQLIEQIPEKSIPYFNGRDSFIGCLAHQLNLVAQAFLASTNLYSLCKVKAVADQVYSHPQSRELWKRLNNGKSNKFIERNVKTRWNSTLRMIQDAIQCKDTLNEYLKLNGKMLEPLEHNDWIQLTQICAILEPFNQATKMVSVSRPVITDSLLIYACIRTIYVDAELVRDNKASLTSNEFMRTIEKTLATALLLSANTFIKYYEKCLDTEAFCIGSTLDPRYKDRWVDSVAQRHPQVMIGFREKLIEKVQAQCTLHNVNELESPVPQQTASMENFFDKFIIDIVPDVTDVQSDIERYLTDKPFVPKQRSSEAHVKPFNIMDWWRDIGSAEYPKLAKVVRQFLSVPSSSACVERIFNAGKDQYGLRRHRLAATRLQKLMVLQRSQRDMRNSKSQGNI